MNRPANPDVVEGLHEAQCWAAVIDIGQQAGMDDPTEHRQWAAQILVDHPDMCTCFEPTDNAFERNL